MDIHKDDCQDALTRHFFWKGRDRLAISLMAAFPLAPAKDDPLFLPAAKIWPPVQAFLPKGVLLDEGFPKPKREFFAAGRAHAPNGAKAAAVEVGIKMGSLTRRLRVTGDRVWKGGAPSTPEPFGDMSLDWARAYGGADWPDNPLGKGRVPDAKTGVLALPNILELDATPVSPNDPYAAACFLPVGAAWPVRQRIPVTNDQEWLARGGPGLPDDFNWNWFLTAHPAQRGDGCFTSGEAFRLSGMSPEPIQGTLPAETAWCVAHRVMRNELSAVSVPLQLDTVWFFPEVGTGVLIWHGQMETADDEASDVMQLSFGFGARSAVETIPVAASAPVAPAPLAAVKALPPSAGVKPVAVIPPPAPPPPPPPLPPPPAVAPVKPNLAMKAPVEKEVIPERAENAVNAAFIPDAAGASLAGDKADIQQMLEEIRGEFANEDLSQINAVLIEKNLPPLDNAQLVEQANMLIDSLQQEIGSIYDQAAHIAAETPAEMTQADLTAKMVELGIDPKDADRLANDFFKEDDTGLDDGTTLDWLAKSMGIDRSAIPIDNKMLAPDYEPPADPEMLIKANAFAVEHFGADLETLLSLDNNIIPVPDNKESLLKIAADMGLPPEVAEELAKALPDDFGAEAEEEEKAKKQDEPFSSQVNDSVPVPRDTEPPVRSLKDVEKDIGKETKNAFTGKAGQGEMTAPKKDATLAPATQKDAARPEPGAKTEESASPARPEQPPSPQPPQPPPSAKDAVDDIFGEALQ